MAVATAKAKPKGIRRSKLQTRRKRRLRCAARAEKTRREEAVKGTGPSIYSTADYELLRTCGFDVKQREMRRREPPTRSTNGGSRLNRKNGWAMEGDAKTLVQPGESAAWLWWLSLPDEHQDDVADLSAKCSDVARDGGGTDIMPDPVELLQNRKLATDGEDVREWGRK